MPFPQCYSAGMLTDATRVGRTVWITGASSGIGADLALRLVREGCRVAFSARREETLRQVVARADDAQGDATLVVPCDVTREESVSAAYASVKAAWGVPDTVIANAGAYDPMDAEHLSYATCRRIIETNLLGAILTLTTVLPDFKARGSGLLAGVASLAGYRGLPGGEGYGTSKAGLISFLESLRFDLRPYGIRVLVINPGFVKTTLTDKNAFPMPCLMSVEQSTDYIIRGLRRRKSEIHYPPRFSWVMKTLRVLPFPLYAVLVRKMVVHD